MKWISIKDRLPRDDECDICTKLLVVIRTIGGPLPEGYYELIELATFRPACEPNSDDYWPGNTAYWEFDGNEQSTPFDVTHWMPLPKLPKEKKNG